MSTICISDFLLLEIPTLRACVYVGLKGSHPCKLPFLALLALSAKSMLSSLSACESIP